MPLELDPCTATYQTTRQTVFIRAEDGPRKGAFLSYHSGCFMSRADFDSLRLMTPREAQK